MKAEQFPPVNFRVLHGRVIETLEGKIPITQGGGYTVRGCGRSWVNTTVHDVFSAWFVDHESRQQHKIDFGEDYLPMRFGDSQECKEQVLQCSAGSRRWLSLFCCAKERHHGGILAYREMTNEGPTAIISVAY